MDARKQGGANVACPGALSSGLRDTAMEVNDTPSTKIHSRSSAPGRVDYRAERSYRIEPLSKEDIMKTLKIGDGFHENNNELLLNNCKYNPSQLHIYSTTSALRSSTRIQRPSEQVALYINNIVTSANSKDGVSNDKTDSSKGANILANYDYTEYSADRQLEYWRDVLTCMAFNKLDFLITPKDLQVFLPQTLGPDKYNFKLPNPGMVCCDLATNKMCVWKYTALAEGPLTDGSMDDTGSKYTWGEWIWSLLGRGISGNQSGSIAWPKGNTNSRNFAQASSGTIKDRMDENAHLVEEEMAVLPFLERLWKLFEPWLKERMDSGATKNLLGSDSGTLGVFLFIDEIFWTYLQEAMGNQVRNDHVTVFMWYISRYKKDVAICFNVNIQYSVPIRAVKLSFQSKPTVSDLERCCVADSFAEKCLNTRLEVLTKKRDSFRCAALQKHRMGHKQGALTSLKLMKQIEENMEQVQKMLLRLQEAWQLRDTAGVMSTVQQSLDINIRISKLTLDDEGVQKTIDGMQELQGRVQDINHAMRMAADGTGLQSIDDELESEYQRLLESEGLASPSPDDRVYNVDAPMTAVPIPLHNIPPPPDHSLPGSTVAGELATSLPPTKQQISVNVGKQLSSIPMHATGSLASSRLVSSKPNYRENQSLTRDKGRGADLERKAESRDNSESAAGTVVISRNTLSECPGQESRQDNATYPRNGHRSGSSTERGLITSHGSMQDVSFEDQIDRRLQMLRK